jgi:CubicO group peptidase (beta-lactamase class C family)
MKPAGVPGVAVGIIKGKQRFVEGFGVSSVDHPLKVDENTLFQIGSITKTFTATLAMLLVEQGKLALDTPVRRYLKDLKMKDPRATKDVTVKHLLTHTAGWFGDFFDDTGRGSDSLKLVVERMAKLPQVAPLGEIWSYNNAGFYLMGLVIETVTDKQFEQVMQELIFAPLEMDHSVFFAEDALPFRTAVGHFPDKKGPRVTRPWALPRNAHPAGGITCSVVDLLKWGEFSMGDGRTASGKRLLKKSSMNLMQTEHFKIGAVRDAIGLGWGINYRGDVKAIGHGGGTNGQLSQLMVIPEKRFALAFLTNSGGGAAVMQKGTDWALKNILNLPAQPKPEAKESPRALLREYSGTYRNPWIGISYKVQPENGKLRLTIEGWERMAERIKIFEVGPAPPPMQMAPAGDDKALVLDGPYANETFEFLRDRSGKVKYVRIGGRAYRKGPLG